MKTKTIRPGYCALALGASVLALLAVGILAPL